MAMPDVNLMVPLLAGALQGMLDRYGREFVKIVDIQPDIPDSFKVRFASGLVLRVRVLVDTQPPTGGVT